MRGDDLEEYRQAQLRLQQAGAQKRAESGARAAAEPPPLPADKKPDVGLSGA